MSSDYEVDERKRPGCPDCGSKSIYMDAERSELVCSDCGLVLEDHLLDSGPEWLAFDAEQNEKRNRAGLPMIESYHDRGLSTEIGKRTDGRGRPLKPKQRSHMHRLRKWDRRSRLKDSKDRNMVKAFTYMRQLASAMELPPKVREHAAHAYRQVIEDGKMRGRSIEKVAVSVMYLTCRELGIPCTPRNFEEYTSIDHNKIVGNYKEIGRKLDRDVPIDTPLKYVPKFASELGLPGPLQIEIEKFLGEYHGTKDTSGKSPTGIAAGGVYHVSCLEKKKLKDFLGSKYPQKFTEIPEKMEEIDLTQKEVAEASGVTEVTIRERRKDLIAFGNENPNFMEDFLEEYSYSDSLIKRISGTKDKNIKIDGE